MKFRNLIYFVLAWMPVGFFSCIEEGENEINGKGSNYFKINSHGAEVRGVDPIAGNYDLIEIRRYTTTEAEMKEAASVSFKKADKIVADVNAALPVSARYVIPGEDAIAIIGSTLEFGAGEFAKSIQFKLDPSKVDFTKKYAVGIALTDGGTGYKVGNAADSVFIEIVVKNQWDGTYASTGTRYNYTASGNANGNTGTMPPTNYASTTGPWNFDTSVLTVNANTVKVHVGQVNGGLGTMNLTINNDNTVAIEATSDTGVINLKPLAGWPSTYNPSTKTFQLYYQWTNADDTHRVVNHKLVKK